MNPNALIKLSSFRSAFDVVRREEVKMNGIKVMHTSQTREVERQTRCRNQEEMAAIQKQEAIKEMQKPGNESNTKIFACITCSIPTKGNLRQVSL